MITSPAFANRKFALLGLARSGLAAARSLAAGGAELQLLQQVLVRR